MQSKLIQTLSFDSELFGYPVGKINWDSSMTEASFLVEASNFQLVYIFSEHELPLSSPDILHVDTKVIFEKNLKAEESFSGISTLEESIQKYGEKETLQTLQFLAFESGHYSRFKVDSRQNSQEFEKLYKLWIDKAISQGNVLVAENLSGMVTFDEKEGFAQIGLIAVHPQHRRKSWGRKLIHAAEHEVFKRGFSLLKIPTQEANSPAMNLYQQMGYSLDKKTFIYHYWRV
ncbi:GNAT family N-acetyltransferase [Algoriphagus kandeliae]|uniref:GNAT family N-acetyltransferase n=1 Tax=Algoriphagus kandeliae TaxID=2562278 RepID=A0A4Y9R228_9BACT|nr:GNAT family N-acetyltransferase [Algoriphagus kandeliae]TFV97245.1 GNAT family N-acetyltransferase [Algoriphagus kandeliae]